MFVEAQFPEYAVHAVIQIKALVFSKQDFDDGRQADAMPGGIVTNRPAI